MDKVSLEVFAQEVKDGLSAPKKRLSSKWFYDEIGDKLFVDIMNMPEYYLTDAEFEILSGQTTDIIHSFDMYSKHFDLFELGAGDGTKTMELLKALRRSDFTYRPIDISVHAIQELKKRIAKKLPEVAVEGAQGEYFDVLSTLNTTNPKVILFMGSNIGNLMDERANAFLKRLASVMNKGDKLLLGVDLKKSSSIVLPAYNDAQGITARFNLNLLHRINRELGGDFEVSNFAHKPMYDEEKGWAMSFLESSVDQKVSIEHLGLTVSFKKGELVFMEVSRKYDDETIARIVENTELDFIQKFYDSKKYFCDILFEKG